MTYSQKLKHPSWQRKRLEILSRDNFTCQFCGSGEHDGTNLQVHHVVYRRREPWDYPNDLYQTLCEDCHQVRQELTDKSVDALRIAIKNIPTQRLQTVVNRIFEEALKDVH